MRKLVHRREARRAGENRILIHLVQRAAFARKLAAGDRLLPAEQRCGFGTAVGLDHGDHHIDAVVASE